jgi:endonuclease YncB( thermonuclease family)
MAWWYRGYAREQSPHDQKIYADAEQNARAGRRGLWRDTDPLPPWEWRSQRR